MTTATPPPVTRTPTLGEVLSHEIPFHRILLHPTPGTATVADVEAVRLREDRLCELIDGTVVEKTMGFTESLLAARLIYLLVSFTEPRQLGVVLRADGMTRIKADQVRIPDVAVYLNERFPGGKLPTEAIPSLVPDLAVEVLSPSNTPQEMDRKLREYFAAGVRLVSYADPRRRQITVYEATDRPTVLDHSATLDGGTVLPGFTLRVLDWLRCIGRKSWNASCEAILMATSASMTCARS